jgi:pentatricopeptide repeat protein
MYSLFVRMRTSKMEIDEYVYTVLLNGLSKGGNYDLAIQVFDQVF